MSSSPRRSSEAIKSEVRAALDAWPGAVARRRLLALCKGEDLDRLNLVGYALARCGSPRRAASDEFLAAFQDDRRYAVRTVVLYARAYLHDTDPRAFVREMGRVASLPGRRPWIPIMEELYWMWSRAPRDMFRLMSPWFAHRDPRRRWVALHGLEIPARRDPRAVLKVLRSFRGERNARVRRLLGHVLGQCLYPRHPDHSLEEMSRWLSDHAAAAPALVRRAEQQVGIWFDSGRGSDRQRRRLLRVSRDYAESPQPAVRAHARRLMRVLEG